MKYLPIENITYKTRLKEEELIRRLSETIEPKKIFRFGIFGRNSTKTYEGQIIGKTFKIRRIIRYRNSFLPRIKGIIENDHEGMSIHVKMRLHAFITVFICLWWGGAVFAFIAFLIQESEKSEISAALFLPLGMLLFAYILTLGGFKFESNKAKNDLKRIFEAEIIKE